MKEEPRSVPAISKSRLEFLFDGVFAIAMTLLVLELKVPDLANRSSIQELAQALGHSAPTFVSYLISFFVLGVFWYRHNQHYHHFRVITPAMLILSFIQLAAAAFFPFCAALLGRYPTNALSLVFYSACVLIYALASLGNWLIAGRSASLSPEVTPAHFLQARRGLIRWCLVIGVLLSVYLVRVFAA